MTKIRIRKYHQSNILCWKGETLLIQSAGCTPVAMNRLLSSGPMCLMVRIVVRVLVVFSS